MNLKQMTFLSLINFIEEYYQHLSTPQKVDTFNEAASKLGASGNIFQNNNGKVDYTKQAFTEENYGRTVVIETAGINSKNYSRKKDTFERIDRLIAEGLKNTNNTKHLLKLFTNAKNYQDLKHLLDKMTAEDWKKLKNIVEQNPQDVELQGLYQNVEQYKGQLSDKQNEEMKLNQNFRQENEQSASNRKFNTLRGF
ncbi:hypothetical protein B0187_09465 [Haemophilus paracuniculus]|uniref:Uncharacterized protein n=2 Tax=Haemophilus paracuniculus TaxID=734 RepID=A0A1T0AQE3_9PAST|nr:hypothetical protein B0187_09465 [Haemophilus paracuniculus]